jgi:hypothetical protein
VINAQRHEAFSPSRCWGLLCAAPGLAGSLHQFDRVGRRLEVQGTPWFVPSLTGPSTRASEVRDWVVLAAAGDAVRPTAIAVDTDGRVFVAGTAMEPAPR